MSFVLVGKIINTHGVKGELKIESHTDFVSERFKTGNKLYVGETKDELIVSSYRIHQGFILVTFECLDNINLVLKYKGLDLFVKEEDIKQLKEGEYYFKDLKNLDVFVENNLIGKVICVESGVKYNYLRIMTENGEKLVPYLKTFVEKVDINNKRINIIKMEGLL